MVEGGINERSPAVHDSGLTVNTWNSLLDIITGMQNEVLCVQFSMI